MLYKVIVILGLIGLLGYASYKVDPFSPYKNFIKKPLSIQPKKLKVYQEEEQLIREALKLNLSKRQKSILAGLHWVIVLMDEDKNFDQVFPDFMLLMHAMHNSHGKKHQREIAQSIIRKSLARAQNKLSKLFRPDGDSRFEFIRLIYILNNFPEFQDVYFRFYEENYKPDLKISYQADGTSFENAIRDNNYQVIFAYLVQTSFLHHYLNKVKDPKISLPEDRFVEHLKAYENFNYNLNHETFTPEFRGLGYLATHIPLILTNYGEFVLKEDINAKKAKSYIETTLDKAHQLGDFDLLAEYIQSLKIFNPKYPKINELEKFIYSLQRPDGSWGSERDFKTNAYTAIHPTGAAMMALNQE